MHPYTYKIYTLRYNPLFKDVNYKLTIKDLGYYFKYYDVVRLHAYKDSRKIKFLVIFYQIIILQYNRIYFYIESTYKAGVKYLDLSHDNNYVILFLSSVYTNKNKIVYTFRTVNLLNLYKIKDFFFFLKNKKPLKRRKNNIKYIPSLSLYFEAPFGLSLELFKKFKNYLKYLDLYKPFNIWKSWEKSFQLFIRNRLSYTSYVVLDNSWKKKLLAIYFVRFVETSVSKIINVKNLFKYRNLFLRKNKIFNKSRYSRNRQLYRTGVYWCLWLNIILVYSLYFYFYRFSFSFGYFWFICGLFFFSFIFSRSLQNNLFSIKNTNNLFNGFYLWLKFFLENLLNMFKYFWLHLLKNYVLTFYLNLLFYQNLDIDLWSRKYRTVYWASLYFAAIKEKRFVYIWEYFQGEDTSFLKWKSKAHWFKQVWKMLTTY